MEIMQITSWLLFSIELLFVVLLFAFPNVGDDAAGQGMARSFGIFLLPMLMLFAGLLIWTYHSTSKALRVLSFSVIVFPFLVSGCLVANNFLQDWQDRRNAAQAGKFPDSRLTKIARAIDRKDYVLEKTLIQQGKMNWESRDATGATLLGHAVKRVRDDYGSNPAIKAIQILLAAGAPLNDSATRLDEHLMEIVFAGNNIGSLELLKVILDAGCDPNAKDSSGLPLIHTNWSTTPKLKLMASHGADLNLPGNRSDRPRWTPLMNAIYMHQWEQALYLIEKDAVISYRASDGNTAASVLADRQKEYGATLPPEPDYLRFLTAFQTRRAVLSK